MTANSFSGSTFTANLIKATKRNSKILNWISDHCCTMLTT